MGVTCALGTLHFEFMTEVTKGSSHVPRSGRSSANVEGSGMCYCEQCARNFLKLMRHGRFPRDNNKRDPAQRK